MKKIIVTGGNGFIGTNLILKLIEDQNNSVLNIDKFSYYSNNYLYKKKNKNLKNVKIDLLNFNKLKKIIYKFKPDFVFHLAAETHVDTSITNPIIFYDNNVKTTLNLLYILSEALHKKILKKNFKFIYVGTDEIYGDIDFKSKKSFDENECLKPNNPYSASKAAAVLTVNAWYNNYNFPSIITNSVNNFGKFQFVEKFIPRSILLGLNKKNIELYGQGKNIRTWLSVEDHVRALILVSKKGVIGEIYNISSGFKLRNIDVAKKIANILKKKKIRANIKFVKDRLNHDRHYSINASKIKKLGWKPINDFEEDLINTIEWYIKNKNINFFKNFKKHLMRKGI